MKTSQDIQFEIFVYIFRYHMCKNFEKYKSNQKIINFLITVERSIDVITPKNYHLFEKRFLL